MNSRVRVFRLRIVGSVMVCLLLGLVQRAHSQGTAGALDHLKCYSIEDSAQPISYVADLQNQFGLAPGCVILVPARLFCAETNKRIDPPVLPPGGGPSGTAPGDFLCYLVRCPNDPTTPDFRVEDQFGRRPIQLDNARLLCAPANKLICGDGISEPGEECDPGSAATNVCPNGNACRPDCTCEPPPPCTSGQPCSDAAGDAGNCVCSSTDPASCTCVVPTPSACPCNASCPMPDGTLGQCSPVGSATFCQCAPPQCPCDAQCTNTAGQTGQCRPGEDAAGLCHCVVPRPTPTPVQCPCEASCTMDNGTLGVCRRVFPGANFCRCAPPPPPTPTPCVCGADCVTTSGLNGVCKPGFTNVCSCVPKPPPPLQPCPCGAQCATSSGQPGRCRPISSPSSGTCGCVAND